MKQDGRWERRGGKFWEGRIYGIKMRNKANILRYKAATTEEPSSKTPKPPNHHLSTTETLVVVRSYWVLHVIQTTSESKLLHLQLWEKVKFTKEREEIKQISPAPRSQTSSSPGPPAPWRRTPEKPRRNAAVRYRPDCPPAIQKGIHDNWPTDNQRKHDIYHRSVFHHISPHVGVTPSSSLRGWDASPALRSTSPSLCHIFSWLPATNEK